MWMQYTKSYSQIYLRQRSVKSPWILVSSFCSDVCHPKAKSAPLQETRMKDRFVLNAKGGDGGSGCSSLRRSRQDRHGRPDGGNGGRGGDVILECCPAIWDFSGLNHHVNASRGGNGGSKNIIGTRGKDKVVQVPIGTVVHLLKGDLPSTVQISSETALDPWELPGNLLNNQQESHHHTISNSKSTESSNSSTATSLNQDPGTFQKLPNTQTTQEGPTDAIQYNVAELTKPRQQIIIARGGEGGLGNTSFPTPKKDEPSPTLGSPGSEAILVLELKSIADVGLVGMPNAGKSTLLGSLSRAKPRVGHYAFTTLRPNLGKLKFDDLSITVADIPGLIKGAHVNRGLGHAFLRHIERTRVLAYVVDLAAGLEGRKGISPWEQLRDLVSELEHHQVGLSDKPGLVVANKIDEERAEEVYGELKRRVRGVPIYPVCAVLEEGVLELKSGLRLLMDGQDLVRLSLDNIDCS